MMKKEYQAPVTDIEELHLKQGCLEDGRDGVPTGSYGVDGLVRDPDIEEIGGDLNANTYHMTTLWDE